MFLMTNALKKAKYKNKISKIRINIGIITNPYIT